MSARKPRDITPGSSGGFFSDLSQRLKLIMRLMGDARVSPFLKILPIASLIYIFLPDIPGPIDDAAIIWLGTYLFVELCPQEIVQEHMDALKSVVPAQWRDPDPGAAPVDAEFRETTQAGSEDQSTWDG
jgi:hypothetical protein